MDTRQNTVTKNDLLSSVLSTTIDEVIAQLENIIAYCEANNNRAGYFAQLYCKVTCKVKECIGNNDFRDGPRMEKLDVAFANRYLEAFYSWLGDKPTGNSWKVAFDAVTDNSALVLQHVLLGMNAHINFDLGISTAETMKGFVLEDIHPDFNEINAILGSMIDNEEACLTKINPLMKLLNLKAYKSDEMLVQFSIDTAREGAWLFAQELSGKAGNDYQNCLQARDASIEKIAESIAKPHSFLLKLMVKTIHLFEKKKVPEVIRLLGED